MLTKLRLPLHSGVLQIGRSWRLQVRRSALVRVPASYLLYSGDDCQLLLWDLAGHTQIPAASPRNASSRLNSPRPDTKKRVITDPVMAYTSHAEISNMAWSPYINSMSLNSGHSTGAGEWLAIAMGRDIQCLKV